MISAIEGKENTYQISNIQSDMKTLDLSVTLPSNTKITLKKMIPLLMMSQKYIRVALVIL